MKFSQNRLTLVNPRSITSLQVVFMNVVKLINEQPKTGSQSKMY